MTIGEYISEKFRLWGLAGVSTEMISAEATRVGLRAEEEYNASVSDKISLFFYHILPEMLLAPSSLSEGGTSVSFDRKALEQYYSLLSQKLGLPNLLPSAKITDISNQW